MAVKLIANYAKRLGLPGYSSHQFSVSVETELVNVQDIAGESERLYKELQQAVDGQITQTGFVPPHEYGMTNGNGRPQNGQNGNTQHQNGNGNGGWQCSEKQKQLIEDIVAKNRLDKNKVEELAQEMFGSGVRKLNKLQASGLIDELLEKNGGGNQRQQRQPYQRQRARTE